MTQFIQLHFLTSYPPANLNRDDLGGFGYPRRVSSVHGAPPRPFRRSSLAASELGQGDLASRFSRL